MRVWGQTEAMRRMAGDDKVYLAEQRQDGWHGMEFVNHPFPSGARRMMLTYSDNRGWTTEEKAIEVIKAGMRELDKAYEAADAEDRAYEDEKMLKG